LTKNAQINISNETTVNNLALGKIQLLAMKLQNLNINKFNVPWIHFYDIYIPCFHK